MRLLLLLLLLLVLLLVLLPLRVPDIDPLAVGDLTESFELELGDVEVVGRGLADALRDSILLTDLVGGESEVEVDGVVGVT